MAPQVTVLSTKVKTDDIEIRKDRAGHPGDEDGPCENEPWKALSHGHGDKGM